MIKEVFQKAVKEQLAKTNNSKWGVEESLEVVKALLIDETGAPEMFARDEKGNDSELTMAIREVINPSQFAQKLESADVLKREGRAKKTKGFLDGFGK